METQFTSWILSYLQLTMEMFPKVKNNKSKVSFVCDCIVA